ncbi:(Fe-S)-binding protein [Fimbriimonas ginsengisoli]|uniref:Glycolate oxidase iron-sulfur subunit n=1 Tax=Fimbriimonas ginsengisoli Gsoil 348 TaxID=661478 RepID=A0A068NQV5_FIMGI|nr:(Fe-S)-binding protein [Fimbriimonas ginsengisoli]AIE85110.1 Glycolate dehydrogenase [Fimbriimonas ginsengisoli Gsoil 348]
MHDLSELTTHCIRCGFCLESCPTFVVTGNEVESPRGRIYLVRSALEGKLRWQEDVREHLDLCLGCRNCETACPSGVEYGAILELARDLIEQEKPELSKKALLASTSSPTILKTQLALGHLLPGRRIPGPIGRWFSGGEAPEADRPAPQATADFPPLDEGALPPVRGEVYLLEGCAMRVLFPRVHQATRRLLRRIGFVVREVEQGCCGSFHAHNGYLDKAREYAAELMKSMPDDLPVVVDSAGCGSTMKEYGFVREGDPAAGAFAARVKDASEFLFANGLLEALAKAPGVHERVTYHDACHLSHSQQITAAPRQLVQAIPGIEYIELPEAEMCCGSAGIYNVTQPQMARTLVERKYDNIASTGARIVAMGNPGCHAWIAQAAREHGESIGVLHTAELLEAAFVGLNAFGI